VRGDRSAFGKVAIKVLPEECFHGPATLGRFTRERRIPAGLDHPNIWSRGPAEPVPIKRYCQDLSLKERVRLSMRAGEAVRSSEVS
jgi:hypothetical protein